MGIGILIPQIAFRARQPGGAFSAATTPRQPSGFDADASDGRPLECIVAAALDRKVLFAERGLGELHTALEWLAIHAFWAHQIADLEDVVVLHPVTGLTVVFDQDAAGA